MTTTKTDSGDGPREGDDDREGGQPVAPLDGGYRCEGCGVDGVKLWRKSATFRRDGDKRWLLCASCACIEVKLPAGVVDALGEVYDEVNGRRTTHLWTDEAPCSYVPAVQAEDGCFWGVCSVPAVDLARWRALPTTPPPSTPGSPEGPPLEPDECPTCGHIPSRARPSEKFLAHVAKGVADVFDLDGDEALRVVRYVDTACTPVQAIRPAWLPAPTPPTEAPPDDDHPTAEDGWRQATERAIHVIEDRVDLGELSATSGGAIIAELREFDTGCPFKGHIDVTLTPEPPRAAPSPGSGGPDVVRMYIDEFRAPGGAARAVEMSKTAIVRVIGEDGSARLVLSCPRFDDDHEAEVARLRSELEEARCTRDDMAEVQAMAETEVDRLFAERDKAQAEAAALRVRLGEVEADLADAAGLAEETIRIAQQRDDMVAALDAVTAELTTERTARGRAEARAVEARREALGESVVIAHKHASVLGGMTISLDQVREVRRAVDEVNAVADSIAALMTANGATPKGAPLGDDGGAEGRRVREAVAVMCEARAEVASDAAGRAWDSNRYDDERLFRGEVLALSSLATVLRSPEPLPTIETEGAGTTTTAGALLSGEEVGAANLALPHPHRPPSTGGTDVG